MGKNTNIAILLLVAVSCMFAVTAEDNHIQLRVDGAILHAHVADNSPFEAGVAHVIAKISMEHVDVAKPLGFQFTTSDLLSVRYYLASEGQRKQRACQVSGLFWECDLSEATRIALAEGQEILLVATIAPEAGVTGRTIRKDIMGLPHEAFSAIERIFIKVLETGPLVEAVEEDVPRIIYQEEDEEEEDWEEEQYYEETENGEEDDTWEEWMNNEQRVDDEDDEDLDDDSDRRHVRQTRGPARKSKRVVKVPEMKEIKIKKIKKIEVPSLKDKKLRVVERKVPSISRKHEERVNEVRAKLSKLHQKQEAKATRKAQESIKEVAKAGTRSKRSVDEEEQAPKARPQQLSDLIKNQKYAELKAGDFEERAAKRFKVAAQDLALGTKAIHHDNINTIHSKEPVEVITKSELEKREVIEEESLVDATTTETSEIVEAVEDVEAEDITAKDDADIAPVAAKKQKKEKKDKKKRQSTGEGDELKTHINLRFEGMLPDDYVPPVPCPSTTP